MVKIAWQKFRQKWSGLHPLSQAGRYDALSQLQPLAETQVELCRAPSFLGTKHLRGMLKTLNVCWL